jgi:hypothetical protein
MAIKLPPLPSPDEVLIVQGGRINPVWYQWLKGLEKRLREAGISELLTDDQLSRLQDGATLRWDSGTQRWQVSV